MKITSKGLIRTASVLGVIYGLAHQSGYPWTPATGSGEAAVLDGMKSISFDVFGSIRTYWDFYVGFGLGITVLQVALGLSLWFLADMATEAPKGMRKVLVLFMVAYAAKGFLAWKYFFAPPLIFCAVITLVLGVGIAKLPARS